MPPADAAALRDLVGELVDFTGLVRIGHLQGLRDRGRKIRHARQQAAVRVAGRHAGGRLAGRRGPRFVGLVQFGERILEQRHQVGVALAPALRGIELLQVVADRRRPLLLVAEHRGLAHVDVDLHDPGRALHRQGALLAVGHEIDGLRHHSVVAGGGLQGHRRQHRRVELCQAGQRHARRHGGQPIDRVLERLGQARDRVALNFRQFAVGHFDLHGQAVRAVAQRHGDLRAAGRGDAQRVAIVGLPRQPGRHRVRKPVQLVGGARQHGGLREIAAIGLEPRQQRRRHAVQAAGRGPGQHRVCHGRGYRIDGVPLPGHPGSRGRGWRRIRQRDAGPLAQGDRRGRRNGRRVRNGNRAPVAGRCRYRIYRGERAH
ncbi:hypothetical protein D3C85_1071590 [compost metagenome]